MNYPKIAIIVIISLALIIGVVYVSSGGKYNTKLFTDLTEALQRVQSGKNVKTINNVTVKYIETKPADIKSTVMSKEVVLDGKTYIVPYDIVLPFNAPWSILSIPAGASPKDSEAKFKQDMSRIQVECRHRARIGSSDDGGWDICLAGPYKPAKDCLVYDFGIAGAWTFDDIFVKEFGCDLRAFDPTMNAKEHKRGEKINFYPIGLHGSNTKMNLGGKMSDVKTLGTLLKQFGDENKTMDYLKFDIEWSEWPALEAMFNENFLSKQVKQIGFESHTPQNGDPNTFRAHINTLNKLEALGFRKWHHNWNKNCIYRGPSGFFTQCNEVYYININFLLKP